MKHRLVAFALTGMLLSASVMAQSMAEISAAKSMARQYGYNDKEINAVLNHNIGATNKTGVARVSTTATGVDPASALEAEVVENRKNTTSAVATLLDNDETVVQEIIPVEEEKKTSDIYGHSFFTSKGLSIVPSYNAPTPASYVLGPGDEVIIDIWGATVSHIVGTLGNDGSISIENLGPAYLNGLNVKEAEELLIAELSKIYSGLKEDGSGDTYLRLSVGKIKGVGVSILGEVVTPGVYTIPSLSSITSAIFMAGGVRETGSVRQIHLYRNGKRLSSFDLYDFIFKGKYDQNLRLQDNDVVMVDAYKNIVTIEGGVMRPMRYELEVGQTVQDLIDYARGFSSDADKENIHVVRKNSQKGKAYDVSKSQFASFKLEDGDVVTVRSNPDLYENRVTISGPVMYPGAYAISNSLSDVAALVKAAGGLREGAYTSRGQINRLDENRLPVFITFDLEKVLSGQEKIELVREDKITLFSQEDFIEDFTVSITGHVMNPGTFAFSEGMTVADVLLLAKGIKEDTYTERGQINRTDNQGIPTIISFNVNDAIRGRNNPELMRGDEVQIYSFRELQEDATITINGQVQSPGTFTYRDGITLEDVVLMAKGFSNGADKTNLEIASRGGRERGAVNLYDLEANPELLNMALKPYDVISVRRLTYFRPQTTVTIEGEVYSPGSYVVDKAEVRLSDVIAKVGGFTDEAYIKGARLTRVLTEEEIARQQLAVTIANQNLSEKDTLDILELKDRFNIGIDLQKAIDNPGSVADIVLRAGDIIDVPQQNNTVKITGGVFYPNTVSFDKNLTWKDYIHQAGGFTNDARKRKTYAVYMNGKVAVRGHNMKMEPGVEIVVPQRNEDESRKMTAGEIASLVTSSSSLAYLIYAVSTMLRR